MTYDAADEARVYARIETNLTADGRLDVTWPDAYRRFDYQPIPFYIDVDADGTCTPGVDVGRRHISTAWNPVDDAPLDQDLTPSTLTAVDRALCEDVDRCSP